jgi:nucleoid-associated protein YgaU
MTLRKALLRVEWHNREAEDIPVQFNPTEFTLDKQAKLAEIAIPGLDSPLQQFVRGETEKLTMDLFFDSTEGGMGSSAASVTTQTDRVYQLLKIEPTRHAPPTLVFLWNDAFPGAGIGAPAAPGGGNPDLSSQRRTSFRCLLESVKQKFTLFSPAGVPLRATLTVSLREYKTLDDQVAQLRLSSPDRTHVHALRARETLAAVAHRYYDKAAEWREIAERNGIEDPRRLSAGQFLEIPSLR